MQVRSLDWPLIGKAISLPWPRPPPSGPPRTPHLQPLPRPHSVPPPRPPCGSSSGPASLAPAVPATRDPLSNLEAWLHPHFSTRPAHGLLHGVSCTAAHRSSPSVIFPAPPSPLTLRSRAFSGCSAPTGESRPSSPLPQAQCLTHTQFWSDGWRLEARGLVRPRVRLTAGDLRWRSELGLPGATWQTDQLRPHRTPRPAAHLTPPLSYSLNNEQQGAPSGPGVS